MAKIHRKAAQQVALQPNDNSPVYSVAYRDLCCRVGCASVINASQAWLWVLALWHLCD
jgi:hypothetical protein